MLARLTRERWIALPVAIFTGYVATRVMSSVGYGAYYDYIVFPHEKGDEYIHPQLRYAFGQTAIFVWALIGLSASVLLTRDAMLRKQTLWTKRMFVAFVLGFVVLVLGMIGGMWLRDLGWR